MPRGAGHAGLVHLINKSHAMNSQPSLDFQAAASEASAHLEAEQHRLEREAIESSRHVLDPELLRLKKTARRVRSVVDMAGDRGEDGCSGGTWRMVTLTYKPERDASGNWLPGSCPEWQPDHISEAIHCFREWSNRLQKRGLSGKMPYVWVAELQRNGRVHYHVLIKVPRNIMLPKWDLRGWWKHGSSEVALVRKSGKRYLAKYLSKGADGGRGKFPRGARCSGWGQLPAEGRAWVRFQLLPLWVQRETSPDELAAGLVKRVPGGFSAGGKVVMASPFAWGGIDGLTGRPYIVERSVEQRLRATLEASAAMAHCRGESLTLDEQKRLALVLCGTIDGGILAQMLN